MTLAQLIADRKLANCISTVLVFRVLLRTLNDNAKDHDEHFLKDEAGMFAFTFADEC